MRPAWYLGMLAIAGCGRMGFDAVASSGGDAAMTAGDGGPDAPPDAMITPGTRTIGYTDVGASTQNTSTNRVWLSTFALTEPAKLQRLVVYIGGGQGANLRGIVYADSAGTPSALLVESMVVPLPAQAPPAWVSLPLAAVASLSPGTYWLGIHNDTQAQLAFQISLGASKNTGDLFADGAMATYAGGQQTFNMQISVFGEYVP